MARPLDPAKLDDAIRLYLAGEPLEKIPAATGVSVSRLHRERSSRGIPPRSHRALPEEQIVASYLAGASEYGLAQQYGVSRGPIMRILTTAGIERRGMSEAGFTRNAGLGADERKRQAAAANRAARMRRAPQIEKHRRALEIERKGAADSEAEMTLATWIRDREQSEFDPIPQRAIGVYNVDLAMLPVAVEVLGGGWHAIKASHAERTPYILDEGWHLVMVWNYEGRSALGLGAAEYVVTFTEKMRRNPPATCQYRVISGQGEVLAARGREDNEFPLVPPPRGRSRARS